MTWSFINQLIAETLVVRNRLYYCGRQSPLLRQNIVILTGLVSFQPQRVFGNFTAFGDEDALDAETTSFLFKETPVMVQNFCSEFMLPGSTTRVSPVTNVVLARQFFDMLVPFNLIKGNVGTLFFFCGSFKTIFNLLTCFLKTRKLLFLRASLYNLERRRFYISSVKNFIKFVLPAGASGLSRIVFSHVIGFSFRFLFISLFICFFFFFRLLRI